MNKVFGFVMTVIAMCVIGCGGSVNGSSDVERMPDAEIIQSLVNFSLIGNDELDELIDRESDDEIVLRMMIDYNGENDGTNFSNRIADLKSNDDLKKRVLILSNGL